jgi:hypothetical protein
MIRSFTSMLPRGTLGSIRYEATEIKPSSIMMYVVANEVSELSRCNEECMVDVGTQAASRERSG